MDRRDHIPALVLAALAPTYGPDTYDMHPDTARRLAIKALLIADTYIYMADATYSPKVKS
jgi:hypothetical protein